MATYIIHNPFPAPPPYEEDIIIDLMVEIYHILILLYYIDVVDVVFAPPEGHPIDEPLCAELGIDERVVSLMKRLPYFRNRRKARPIFPPSVSPLIYTNADHIRASRSPLNLGLEPEDQDNSYILPQELPLFAGSTRDWSWILDVSENTIRQVDPTTKYGPPEASISPTDHRFASALSAPHLLGEYVSGLRTLRFIPDETQPGISDVGDEDPELEELLEWPRRVKMRLLGEFGWPNAFRADDWARDHKHVWQESRPPPRLTPAEDQRRVAEQVNAARARAGLPPLAMALQILNEGDSGGAGATPGVNPLDFQGQT